MRLKPKNKVQIILYLIMAMFVTSCSDNWIDYNKLTFRGGLYYTTEGELYSGETRSLKTGGTVIFEGYIKDGLKYRKWTYYYDNGLKKTSGYFKNGLKDGKWLLWNEEGQLNGEEFYKDGNLIKDKN
jgi:antitoxin component YwqK of YwqJK toxin-antitoxin module